MQTIHFLPSPNFWAGRFGATPKYIIVHGTAGGTSAQNIANWFANPASQVSANYVIDRDATIFQTVREEDSAWANGVISGPAGTGGDGVHHDSWWDSAPTWNGAANPNLNTISIEHVKPSLDNSDALTPAQQAASFELINDICSKWNIPKCPANASGGITGHFSMDPVNRKLCPNTYPWEALWRYLGASGDNHMIPSGWRDDGTTLTAPNGIGVVRGFRQFVLDNQWNKDNWPLEPEHAQSPLELSNPSLGNGTQQVFRWTTLEWTPQHGVFVAWSGEELLALRAQIAKLEAK